MQRFEEVEAELGKPDVFDDQKRYKALAQEHAYLTSLKETNASLEGAAKQLEENKELMKEEREGELHDMLRDDCEELEKKIEALDLKIRDLLVPPDPNDNRNTILEIRAGTGGDEAALFVGDCVRMYKLYADHKGWKYEQLAATESEAGGYKEYIMVLSGPNVHRLLQYEGGTHRVQRVPATEAQGRIHTSAVTMAILLEPDEEEEVQIEEKDLKIETTRASGAGGQHVNTTDSAVRMVHIPTGLVATCQDEKSQHKNKDKALRMLKAKVAEKRRQEQQAAISDARSAQVGSGDRSERIRTYNFPQNRVTDHRINLTRYSLDRVIDGDLDEVIGPLVLHFHEQKLK